MTSTPPLRLSSELLNRLEQTWVEQHAPLASHLRPGLTDTQMDDITAPLGVLLPPEARLWWGWHDGVDAPGPYRLWATGAGQYLLSLQESVAEALFQRSLQDALTDPNSTAPTVDLWRLTRVPAIDSMSGSLIAIDTADRGPLSPVYWKDRDGNSSRPPVVPSLGTMISWWIDALEDGLGYDRTTGQWRSEFDGVPDDRARTHVLG